MTAAARAAASRFRGTGVLLALSAFIVAIGVAYHVSTPEPLERGRVEVQCFADLALHYGDRHLTF